MKINYKTCIKKIFLRFNLYVAIIQIQFHKMKIILSVYIPTQYIYIYVLNVKIYNLYRTLQPKTQNMIALIITVTTTVYQNMFK